MHKGFMLIEDEVIDKCINCLGPAIIKYCRSYSGYRGKCTVCDSNWPES